MLRGMRLILRKSQGLATGLRAGSNSFQRTISFPRPVITTQDKASQLVLRTQLSTKPPLQPKGIDREAEKKAGEKLIEPRPDEVSTVSSTIPIIGPSAPTDPSKDVDFGKGLRDDIDTVKETFALGNVPREAYTLGLAGTLPYLATSVATVFYSWDLNTQWPTDSALLNSFLVSKESAIHWLGILEPIQVGYGVVLISFLGAIHWGLEFAEKARDPVRTQFRYAVGVLAPLVAWPTTFMPIEWALTTQFLAFTALYFVDSRAMVRGWAPTWYQTYRFVLTAVVGGAILVSLVSRTKIGENHARLSTPELKDLFRQSPDPRQEYHNWDKEEEEERQRLRKEKKKQEEKKKEEQKSKEEEKKKPQEKADRQNAKPGEKKYEKKYEKKDEKKEDKKDDSNKGSNKKEQQVSDEEGSNQDKKKDETGDQEHGRKNSEKTAK